MVIATIPARYAAPQTARTLSIFVSSIFESHAAFSQRSTSLYSLYYTHFRGNFNHFVQLTFPVFIDSAQCSLLPVNCRKCFLQFILHFSAAFRPRSSCKNAGFPSKNPRRSASFPPSSPKRRRPSACCPAHFLKAPSFLTPKPAKNGRDSKSSLPVL